LKKPPQGKVVEAVGAIARSPFPGLGKRIEQAMSDAVKESYAAGVTEPAKVKARMMEAREKVKQEFHEAEVKASESMQAGPAGQGTDATAPKA